MNDHTHATQGIMTAFILGCAAWLIALKFAFGADLEVTAYVPQSSTIDPAWIAQSPETHWPDHAVDVRWQRVDGAHIVTVSY